MCISHVCAKVSRWKGNIESCSEFKACRKNHERAKQTRLLKYFEGNHAAFALRGLLAVPLCFCARDPYYIHSPLCSGFAGMPGHLFPGRPVLAGTFLLFWECTGVFIRLSVRVGYLTRSNIFCVHYAQALGINVIVLKTQDAGFSLCSVPGAPQSHFYLVDDSLIFFFSSFFFLFLLQLQGSTKISG